MCTALDVAAQRLAFAKILSDRLGGGSRVAGETPALLDMAESVGRKVEVPPSSIVAVLSMRVWT